ncbi:uncharacterized protein LOC124287838 [Haliotis rubra]|uniref:uncharacterized protein LOC124287838 n=1 Tax=Haliotis rubra TaxID=36100 RepID=UPI001EE555E3|nr:uncharacterized protein LOC124287838 [Haliotis rubra]
MEKQYSVQFFTSFIEKLQGLCRNSLDFSQTVDVSGYLCLEIDNMKKERYVLSELLQSNGNVVSESYCTKAFKTSQTINPSRPRPMIGRNNVNVPTSRDNVHQHNQNRRRSRPDSSGAQNPNIPSKVRRSVDVIEVIDDDQSPGSMNSSGKSYQSNPKQGQRWPAGREMASMQRPPQSQVKRSPVSQNRQKDQYSAMMRQQGQYGAMGKPPDSYNATMRQQEQMAPRNRLQEQLGSRNKQQEHYGAINRLQEQFGAISRQQGQFAAMNSPQGQYNAFNRQQLGAMNNQQGQLGAINRQQGQLGAMNNQQGQLGTINNQQGQLGAMNNQGQLGALNSPQGQLGALNSPQGQLGALNSPQGQLGALNSPPGQLGTLNSPQGQLSTMNRQQGQLGAMNSQLGQYSAINRLQEQFGATNRQQGQVNRPRSDPMVQQGQQTTMSIPATSPMQQPLMQDPRSTNEGLRAPNTQNANVQGNIEQFNVQRPPPTPPVSASDHIVRVKSEFGANEGLNTSNTSTVPPPAQASASAPPPPAPAPDPAQKAGQSSEAVSQPAGSTNNTTQAASSQLSNEEPLLGAPEEVAVRIKQEPIAYSPKPVAGLDEDGVIDLDLFDDDLDDNHPESSAGSGQDDQTALAKDYGVPNKTVARKEDQFNLGSKKVVDYAVQQFKKYHFSKSGLDFDMLTMETVKLDSLLLDFFQGVRKGNGEELTARTLKNVQIHLDMYLRDNRYPYSIEKDDAFKASRDFLKNKLDQSKTGRHMLVPIDDNEIEILFQRQVLGDQNPDSLMSTMWFLNSKYLGIRRPADHYNLRWGDIRLCTDEMGIEYLERVIKGSYSLKVFAKAQTPSRCFVNLYKKYWTLRPQDALLESSPFYLNFNAGPNYPRPELWFFNDSLSWSRFSSEWKKILTAGGLPPNKKPC